MTARTFNLHQAELLARISAAAYQSSPAEIAAQIHGEEVEIVAAGAAFGFTARIEHDVILAFRGTAPPGNDGALAQWLANMNYNQLAALGGLVHQGFYATLDLVWPQILALLQRQLRPSSQLWVTGHSQGGALAIVAGARLRTEGIIPAGVYTFGSPRVADADFLASYNAPVYRVEHGNDIVCHLPPPPAVMKVIRSLLEKLGPKVQWILPEKAHYKHVGRLTFIDWDGQLIDEHPGLAPARFARLPQLFWSASERQSLLSHHSIDAYVDRLAQAMEREKNILK